MNADAKFDEHMQQLDYCQITMIHSKNSKKNFTKVLRLCWYEAQNNWIQEQFYCYDRLHQDGFIHKDFTLRFKFCIGARPEDEKRGN